MSIPQTLAPFEPEIPPSLHLLRLHGCGHGGRVAVQYPANVKFLRLPYGKTDIRYLLEAFEQGRRRVPPGRRPIGNCHHVRGNERGRARLHRAKRILDESGLGGERLEMFFMSGSQAHAFAVAAQTMTERIRKLGPNPLKPKEPEGVPPKTPEPDTDEETGWRGRRPRPAEGDR